MNKLKGITTMKWISVEDRLPKEPGEYLTFSAKKKHIRIRIFTACIGMFFSNGQEDKSITHWMPLPSHPGSSIER
jgi:hypothetical protein